MAADISERIRAIYSTLSKGQKKIANAVLNDYDKVAYLTAAKLGEARQSCWCFGVYRCQIR